MGKETVRFRCLSCGHCCTDVVCLPTPRDVIRIAKATGETPYDFLEFLTPDELDGVDKSDPTWLKCCGERYMMALRRRRKKGCHFLRHPDKTCGIYDVRPILCRLFPFKLHETKDGEFKSFSLHKNVECPRCRDEQVKTDRLYELYLEDSEHQEDYEVMVRVFNRQKHTDPQDFIETFIIR